MFAGDFRANLHETNADISWMWFNLQRDTENRLPNIQDTFAESLQLQMSVLHQSMCICKAGLSSQVHMMAGENAKKST